MLNDSQLQREPEDRQAQNLQSAAQEWLSVRQLQDLLGIGHTKAYSYRIRVNSVRNLMPSGATNGSW